MGATCIAANCVGSYFCCSGEEYRGNIIFQPINHNLVLEGEQYNEEDTKILQRCEQLLKESEEERAKIANKFKDLLVNTGACVINKPTLERALLTYIIYLLEQIILCAKEKKVAFDKNDFSISNFIKFSKQKPFLMINQNTLDNLKAKYGFDFNMIESLGKGKSSLINFLSTVIDTKNVIEKQYEMFKGILFDLNNYYLLKKLKDALEGIKFIINYFGELTSSIFSVQSQITNPRKIELFFKIANDAAEKNIRDPKELALCYSIVETCGSVNNWQENIGYKKIELLKY